MPKFDPTLAKAELRQFKVLIEHHLRRIRIACDYETAQEFHRILEELREKAGMTTGKVKRILKGENKRDFATKAIGVNPEGGRFTKD